MLRNQDADGREYDLDYICDNPIPARCKKCGRTFTDGEFKEAIRAPALSGCRCFYCSGELVSLEKGGPSTVEQVEQLKAQSAAQPMLKLF